MACRGIRGAISVEANGAESIVTATRQLLENIVSANGVAVDDLVSIIFTVTPDLDAAYPARRCYACQTWPSSMACRAASACCCTGTPIFPLPKFGTSTWVPPAR